jgi:hypothetical protein
MSPARRFADALRELRWAQVVLELMLLIAGILIALAVDGWIDDRRDERAELRYLELLQRDLDSNLDVLAETLEFEERQAAAAAMAYRALRARPVPAQEREAVAAALNQLTARRTLRLARATYTDLLSTGNLRLIRNATLRDRVVDFYERAERTLLIRDRNNQMFVDQMYMPHLLDSALVSPRQSRDLPFVSVTDRGFAARVGEAGRVGDDRLWRLSPDAPEWNVLAGKVWYRGLASQGALEQSRQLEQEVRSVRELVAGELARRWSR